MIQLTGASMRFGPKVLFEGLNWLITPQERVAIVGANGTGKTTLLKILAGLEQLDSGTITQQKSLRVGYLPQDGLSLSGRSVFEECLSVFDEALAIEREQEALTEKMGLLDHEGAEYAAVAERYQWVHDRYLALDGYTKEAQVGSVLAGLGFVKNDWSRRTEEFSGGWQMRIVLAKLLLEKPNLLLLDEPTNHLDLEARNWLEDYLSSYPYACLLISHDRYFIDTTVKKIIEIWHKKVHFYAGNYSKYEAAKRQRLEQIQAAYKNQRDEIRRVEAFINRFRYKASKARQVQSRVRALGKIERIEVPDEEATIHFRFPQPKASGRVVVRLEHAAKSYGPNEVFRDVSLSIEKGSRIALVGHNGAGKSTLIRMLADGAELSAGERVLGYNAEVDYFAQDQYKALDPDARVFDDIASVVPSCSDTEIRSLLGCFLFSGDDVFKPIGVLSGGERNRYALARMLMRPSNLMLLDEPTNHLDLRAKDVLLRALLDFTSTIVFVSHDRYFIDKLATHVYAIGGGEVRVYAGNYEDYLWQTEREARPSEDEFVPSKSRKRLGKKATQARRKPAPSVSDALRSALRLAGSEANGAERPKRGKRMNPILAKRARKQIDELEAEIARFETEAAELEVRLGASRNHQQAEQITKEMELRQARIQVCEKQWEELSEKLEAEA